MSRVAHRSMLLVIALAASVCIAADTPAPKSPAATAAIKKAEVAITRAEEAFRQAKALALKQLVTDLKGAMANATKAGNLDEANAIKAKMDEAMGEVDALANAGKSHRFVIRADRPWQNTVDVRAANTLTIRAMGKWNPGPAHSVYGPAGGTPPGQDAERFYLEGRIGNGNSFRVGESMTVTAEADGALQLQMFDSDHSDNGGEMRVVITIE